LGTTGHIQGVNAGATAREIKGFSATVGNKALPTAVMAVDLSGLSTVCGRRVDGIVGLDFFRRQVVQIDYATRRVRLMTPGETVGAGQAFDLVGRNDALCVRMEVDGRPGLFRVDTGCSSALQWAGRPEGRRDKTGTSLGVTTSSPRYISCEVKLGDSSFSGVRTGLHRSALFAGEAGLLGNGLLQRFTVTIDAAGKRLTLARSRG
jgi:hypothetical protein